MDRPRNTTQWNISRSWPLPVKSPAQSLDYRANSYHIHLSILRFHGYGEEISQICPCPFCPINTSFSGTPPSHHSTASTLLSWRQHYSRTPRTSTRTSSNHSQVFDLLSYEEMAINFVIPEVSVLPFLLYFYCTPIHPQSVLPNPFCFCSSFRSQKFLGFGR